VDASPHLPLLTALLVLAPERDADGDEAHEKDLDCHASSTKHRLCQRIEWNEVLGGDHPL